MKRMRKSRQSKFPWCLWHWTTATENLFTLSREDLFVFTLLVDEANKK